MATLATFQVLSSPQVLEHVGRHTSNSAGSSQHEPSTGFAYLATPEFGSSIAECIAVPRGALPRPLFTSPPHTLHPLSPAEQMTTSEVISFGRKTRQLLKKNFDKFISGPVSSHKRIHLMHCPLFPALPKGKGFSFIGFLNDTSLARRDL